METSKNTQFSNITINGVEFISYKHWSYEGNVGIYLMDGVSRVGEIINDKPVFFNLSEDELNWLKSSQDVDVVDAILGNLKFNGKPVRSINTTEKATRFNHSVSLLINNHLIIGFCKEDCLLKASELSLDKCFRNEVEWFTY